MTELGAPYAILAYAISLAVMGGYAIVLWVAYRSAQRREQHAGGKV